MKRWLCLLLALIALGILPRLPHPARDVAKLDPVRTVWITMDGGMVRIETDTGDRGTGADLPEAAAALKAGARREIFLETAEFLILDPSVPITEAMFTLLRPNCSVVFSGREPDLKNAADYLSVHEPQKTLAYLRAAIRR